jgi:hypothetical protein
MSFSAKVEMEGTDALAPNTETNTDTNTQNDDLISLFYFLKEGKYAKRIRSRNVYFEGFCLLGCNVIWSIESEVKCRRNMSPPYLVSKNKPSKKAE